MGCLPVLIYFQGPRSEAERGPCALQGRQGRLAPAAGALGPNGVQAGITHVYGPNRSGWELSTERICAAQEQQPPTSLLSGLVPPLDQFLEFD